MKIDSGLSGYSYQSRSPDGERRSEEAPLREAEAPKRQSSFTVESSTLLSASLANALWMVGESRAPEILEPVATRTPTAQPLGEEWVADRYREFAEF
ncbi:MAG: hypothetical protein ACK4N1_10630 [Pseudorhizobium sp.]